MTEINFAGERCEVHLVQLLDLGDVRLCALNTTSGPCTPPPPPPPPRVAMNWVKVTMPEALMHGAAHKATTTKPHCEPPNHDWDATITIFDDGSAVAFTVENLGAGCETCGHGGGMAPPEFWIGRPRAAT